LSADLPHQTPTERAARGKDARAAVPRRSHGGWAPSADRADPVEVLLGQARTRVPELVPIRHARMAVSPSAFYRGAAAIMAADLAATPRSGYRVQLCGDAHLYNFGGFASPERTLVFSVNDFDETLPGPWEWDVKRLGASFAMAGRDRGFSAGQRRSIVAGAMRRYRETMREFAAKSNLDVWYARLDVSAVGERLKAERGAAAASVVEQLEERARTRDSLRALAKFTREVDGERRIISDPPLIVPVEELISEHDPKSLNRVLLGLLETYRESLSAHRRVLFDAYRPVHVARKVVGVGSVGTRTWICLLLGRDENDPLFLQLKEAQPSVLAPYVDPTGPVDATNQGERVVVGQHLMQPVSDIFLGWFRTTGLDGERRDFYVRQLTDWKIAADVARMSATTMELYGETCGWALAAAHARTGDRIGIAAYLGSGQQFDEAVTDFSEAYADQNDRDYRAMLDAIESGRLEAAASA
jgi:uncharacterized protein (DUF2252 family)